MQGCVRGSFLQLQMSVVMLSISHSRTNESNKLQLYCFDPKVFVSYTTVLYLTVDPSWYASRILANDSDNSHSEPMVPTTATTTPQ